MRISDWSSDVCSSDLVHHLELRLILAAAALRGDVDMNLRARHHLDVEHRGGVVLGVHAAERGVGEDRGAELVVGVEIRLAPAFIDHLLQAARAVVAADHAPFDEYGAMARALEDTLGP